MKIFIVLLVRDEADIIKAWLDHHRGVADGLIVTDNGSLDGTREILAAEGCEVIDQPPGPYWQSSWVDAMIRRAIRRGADWVVPLDADEFIIGDLRGEIERAGPHNILQIKSRNFVVTTADDPAEPNPVRRMRYRHESNMTWAKVFFATKNYKVIRQGNHEVDLRVPRNIKAVDEAVLALNHYPERSWPQYRRKYTQGGEAYWIADMPKKLGWHWRDKYDIYLSGGTAALRDAYEQAIIEPDGLIHDTSGGGE